MTQPLFIEPAEYLEKKAAETELPEDPNAWPQEILQELYKQVPYVADFEPHVQMAKADGEKGYGFGYIEVSPQTEAQMGTPPDQMQSAGLRSVRIPIVVKSGKMSPFDLLITDDAKVKPLTEGRLRQAIFRPQMFDVTARTPGDQSMVGQLYPPYRQNYGFGGGSGMTMTAGMGKEGSALEEYLEKEAAAIDDYMAGQHKHGRLGKKTAEGEARLGMLSEFVEKTAAVDLTKEIKAWKATQQAATPKGDLFSAVNKAKDVAKAKKLKVASVLEEILPTIRPEDYEKLAAAFSSEDMQAALHQNRFAVASILGMLAAHTPTEKLASVATPTVVQVSRVEPGSYKVKSANHAAWAPVEERIDRRELVQRFGEKIALATDTAGSVTMAEGEQTEEPEMQRDHVGPISEYGVYKVQDTEGNEHIGVVIPHLVDTDGQRIPIALFTNGSVAAIQADIVGAPAGETYELPSSGNPSGYGVFYTQQGGEVLATVPIKLAGSFSGEDGMTSMQGETFDGRPVVVSQQPQIQEVVGTEDKMLIPADWQWMSLSSANAVALVGAEQDMGTQEEAKKAAASVFVRAGGADSFSIDGVVLSKLASDEKNFLSLDDAMFLLAGLGVSPNYGIKKLGQAYNGREPVQVKIARAIQLPSAPVAEDMPILRRELFKEAAYIPDPVAVDTVLSLGFINPENIMVFVGCLPSLEEAQMRLCELLLAARLGLQNIPATALEKSVRTTEEVIEGLKILAFQG